MNDINMSTTSSTEPNEASPSGTNKPEQQVENELLSASYKIFNKNFTTLMKYANSSNTLDINMAIDSSPTSASPSNNDLFSSEDVEAKKQLDDLLAAASLSTPDKQRKLSNYLEPIPSTSGLKRQINNLNLAQLETSSDEPKQFVNPVELSAPTKPVSSRSPSSSSSCSSSPKSSSSSSSSSSSNGAGETTLVKSNELEHFNSNTNKHVLHMSKPTLPSTPLLSQSSSKLSSPLMANNKAKTSIQSQPEQAKPTTSAAVAAKPAAFNIENELIKYTKSLKLSTQSYLSTYKLGAHIRNGGFSEIYEGSTQAKNENVIIKLIPKHKTKNWLMVHNKKYPAEVLLHKMCNSINGIVKMVEFFEQEHEWIIIMSKLNNCMDLFDYLESKQRGRLSENEACHFFKQLVKINIDLFNQGVVHRDLKSENLLVDLDTLNLVLIDFGASAIYRNASQHYYTDFHGTRQYKPPEYIKHKKYTAQASTIWTLGILLYDMCNGQLPFETEQEITEYNLQIKANVSEEYKKILLDCLKPDPSMRPTLAQLLEYPWCTKYAEAPVKPSTPKQTVETVASTALPPAPGANNGEEKLFDLSKKHLSKLTSTPKFINATVSGGSCSSSSNEASSSSSPSSSSSSSSNGHLHDPIKFTSKYSKYNFKT